MTDIAKVRLKIGTVVGGTFTDAQIQAFLDMEGSSILFAAAAALESWAAAAINNMVSEHIGDYIYQRQAVGNALKLAEQYRKAETTSAAMTWAEMALTEVGEMP